MVNYTLNLSDVTPKQKNKGNKYSNCSMYEELPEDVYMW